jgi:type IV pilus assembly protein PilB
MEILGIKEPVTIARPQGCQFCNNTGYKGRIAVHELMYMNDAMKNAVLNEKNLDVLRKLAVENGMVPLWNSCRNLVTKGITSIQELMSLNEE